MPFRDLRGFIQKCEKTGDLVRVHEEVDWNLELGAILRRGCELQGPAPLFEKTKDYSSNFRQMGNVLATFRRLAIALDLPPESTYMEILDAYDERRKRSIKPILLKDGPCKQNMRIGEEVDLLELPVPFLHGGDGGRFIATWHVVCTKDPDSDWVNWGMYRQMISSKNSTGGSVAPTHHIGRIFYEKYEPRGIPMEFAVAIGPDPITTLIGTAGVPYGVSEVDIIGGVRGEPLEVVRCETVDLVVPATAEIVYEGIVPPNVRVPEGPFGEYLGYAASPKGFMSPQFQVKALYYRNDPILTSSCMGVPVDDSHVALNISRCCDVREVLRDAGLPVVGVYCPPESCGGMAIVSVKTPYPHVASQVAGAIWANKSGQLMFKVIVVDDDVDYTNMGEVIHAFTTKYDPVRGTQILPHTPGAILVPFASPWEKRNNSCSKVYFDCTWPLDWEKEDIPTKSSFKVIYPEEIQKKVLSKWETYGFKK